MSSIHFDSRDMFVLGNFLGINKPFVEIDDLFVHDFNFYDSHNDTENTVLKE